jgi:hypothetical protein
MRLEINAAVAHLHETAIVANIDVPFYGICTLINSRTVASTARRARMNFTEGWTFGISLNINVFRNIEVSHLALTDSLEIGRVDYLVMVLHQGRSVDRAGKAI